MFGVELLVLVGDIDMIWCSFELFCGWLVLVFFVFGNYEFDCCDVDVVCDELCVYV